MAAPVAVRLTSSPGARADMAAPVAVRLTSSGGAGRAMLEALVAGGAEGLVLVQDSAACEGRSLLRAFVSAAVQRAERVLVVLFDVPREQFEAGLSPPVKERLLFRDGFSDPLGWMGPEPELRAGDFGGLVGGALPPGGPLTLVLDSLSWLLLRLPPPSLCQALGALLGGPPNVARPSRLLVLLHGDLHPPGLLGALGALASAQLTLGGPPPAPGAPRLARVTTRPRRGGLQTKDESFTLLPDGSLRTLGTPPPTPEEEETGRVPPRGPPTSRAPGSSGVPPHPLTFRLQLSAAERAARAAVPPPYQLSPPRRSTLLQTPGTIVCAPDPPEDEDPEDPDDDLDV